VSIQIEIILDYKVRNWSKSMIEEGESVPKFQLEDSNGNIVKSSDLKGKKHVIYFYPRDFTPGCTTEADEFSKDYKKFKKSGIEVVGISKDDVDSHKKFCDKMKIPYILLSDIDTEVSKKFGVWGKKKFMGREFMGIIRSTFLVNEKGKIFKVYPKVKPAGHSKEVLEAFIN
jgi:peroxiredoxin Q/BCP